MIIDRIEYAEKYAGQLAHLKDALNFIRENPDPGEGKHPFSGGWLMKQAGMTKALDDGPYEAHRRYIDVQILIEGREIIRWNRLENMTALSPYNEDTDKQALSGPGSILELVPGMFCVLYPEDAHAACRHLDGDSPAKYVKYVVKLKT